MATATVERKTVTQRNLTGFKHLSNFRDLKDFNNQFEQAMLYVKSHFTKAEYIALNHFRKRCASVVGVTNARIALMVADTHKDGVGISRRTFERMLNKGEQLGLFGIYNTKRKNGSQSSNIYYFNRLEMVIETLKKLEATEITTKDVGIVQKNNTIDVAEEEKLARLDTKNPIYSHKDIKALKSRKKACDKDVVKTSNEVLDASYVFGDIPKEFADVVSISNNNAITIKNLWSRVKLAGNKLFVNCQDTLTLYAKRAYHVLWHRKKTDSRPLHNDYAYFYSVLERMLKENTPSFFMPSQRQQYQVKTKNALQVDATMDGLLDLLDQKWA